MVGEDDKVLRTPAPTESPLPAASQDRSLPGYVQREFDDYLKHSRLRFGFLSERWGTSVIGSHIHTW
ncbi:MAG: hypothetical protein OEQ39_16915 [Gammaproteobacteria bacterium]|nr:hypothetical protein [Gammaproteobacteria bacterium]